MGATPYRRPNPVQPAENEKGGRPKAPSQRRIKNRSTLTGVAFRLRPSQTEPLLVGRRGDEGRIARHTGYRQPFTAAQGTA